MKKNKGLLIAGAVSTVGAIVGSGLLYKKMQSKKTQTDEIFNVLKLSDKEFVEETKKQLSAMLEDLELVEQSIPTFVEDIENNLVMKKPLEFGAKVESYQDTLNTNNLDVILLKNKKTSKLVKEASELEELKREVMQLGINVLKAYTTANAEDLAIVDVENLRSNILDFETQLLNILPEDVDVEEDKVVAHSSLVEKVQHKLHLPKRGTGKEVKTEEKETDDK